MRNYSKFRNRVDIQSTLLTAITVIVSCTLVFAATYYLSYNDMIKSLQDRVESIYASLADDIDASFFHYINEKNDIELDVYQEQHRILLDAKEKAGVMFIFTAKVDENDEFVYVVDGLDLDNPDFRYPGDLIEDEIQNKMHEALSSEIVMPNKIKDTSWGYIFIAYMPIINDDGTVAGVLGIEFDAGHQFENYRLLMIFMPIIIILFCIMGSFASFMLFRRISNPSYQDMSNTDILTDLKNRNAFAIDIENLNSSSPDLITIMSIDLDNLKHINDTKGHLCGDEYIKSCVDILKVAIGSNGVIYRIGGDEFAIIMTAIGEDTIKNLIDCIEVELATQNEFNENKLALSVGYAIYDKKNDAHLMEAFQRADDYMYELKRKKRK